MSEPHMPDVLQPRWLKNLITIALLICMGLFMLPFLKAFAWGIWIAILTWPAWRMLNRRIGRPALAAAVMLLGLLIVVGLPTVLLVRLSAGEVFKLVHFAIIANREGLQVISTH